MGNLCFEQNSSPCFCWCRSLCHSVKHSGLLGLLIFHIKNEVDVALRCGGMDSPFLGHSLVPLLDTTFIVRDDEDLLTDSDR